MGGSFTAIGLCAWPQAICIRRNPEPMLVSSCATAGTSVAVASGTLLRVTPEHARSACRQLLRGGLWSGCAHSLTGCRSRAHKPSRPGIALAFTLSALCPSWDPMRSILQPAGCPNWCPERGGAGDRGCGGKTSWGVRQRNRVRSYSFNRGTHRNDGPCEKQNQGCPPAPISQNSF